MTKNVGSVDRIVRGAAAIALVIVAAVVGFGSAVGVIALVLAAVMAVTAVVRFCPLYVPFRFNTCSRR